MKKTILITGVTGVIGKAVAMEFASKGNLNLILIGRNLNKLNEVKSLLQNNYKGNTIQTVAIDLSDTASIKSGIEKIKSISDRIHALINVAAVYKSKRELTQKGFETMFATNHLGPFQLTNGLLDVLKNTEGSKILTVTAPSSTKIEFDNLNGEKKFSAFTAFGASKMENLLFAFKLAKEFHSGNHASMAFHPGLVKSEILHEAPGLLRGILKLISSRPEEAARAICNLVLKDDKNQNGKFYTKGEKELKAANTAYDEKIQDKLWEKSRELIGA